MSRPTRGTPPGEPSIEKVELIPARGGLVIYIHRGVEGTVATETRVAESLASAVRQISSVLKESGM